MDALVWAKGSWRCDVVAVVDIRAGRCFAFALHDGERWLCITGGTFAVHGVGM